MGDLELAIIRLTQGGLMAGHGAQKLFGWFEGPGLQGTAGFMEALGLRPGNRWGMAAALSEFGGGTLTALGLLYPIGPLGTIASMSMATAKAHWGKPIWVTAGGAELPVTNIAVALALAIAGPGRFSLDRALGIRLPGPIVGAAALATGAMVGYGILGQPQAAQQAQEQAGAKSQGGQEASPATEGGKGAAVKAEAGEDAHATAESAANTTAS